jgi:hypothetical protein
MEYESPLCVLIPRKKKGRKEVLGNVDEIRKRKKKYSDIIQYSDKTCEEVDAKGAINIISSISYCSWLGKSNRTHNCLEELFMDGERVIDNASMASWFNRIRSKVVGKNGDQRRSFVHSAMKTIVPEIVDGKRGPNQYFVMDGTAKCCVCRYCYCALLDVSQNEVKKTSYTLRMGAEMSNFNVRAYVDNTFMDNVSVAEASAVYEDWCNISPEKTWTQYPSMRCSVASQEAFLWMETFFSYWESCPMTSRIHLDTDTKMNIHAKYAHAQLKCPTAQPPLTYENFLTLWTTAFPFVTINRVWILFLFVFYYNYSYMYVYVRLNVFVGSVGHAST